MGEAVISSFAPTNAFWNGLNGAVEVFVMLPKKIGLLQTS